mmetsp:Transcript_48822/g.145896  ORF Transcript_48822/g.145896 Transcript_48822/m.145896 type:complete len:241 (-) Transcript_48822:787-1509(-)
MVVVAQVLYKAVWKEARHPEPQGPHRADERPHPHKEYSQELKVLGLAQPGEDLQPQHVCHALVGGAGREEGNGNREVVEHAHGKPKAPWGAVGQQHGHHHAEERVRHWDPGAAAEPVGQQGDVARGVGQEGGREGGPRPHRGLHTGLVVLRRPERLHVGVAAEDHRRHDEGRRQTPEPRVASGDHHAQTHVPRHQSRVGQGPEDQGMCSRAEYRDAHGTTSGPCGTSTVRNDDAGDAQAD